ncbi:MAG: antibiotic biosynthesis monooxygenase [Acetobacter sp.]|uniref:antibiotic biosynthesis monooxygenase family protein n=1 Tax=Acetobacter sp. TaxID=440 RepID=UPI0039E904E0
MFVVMNRFKVIPDREQAFRSRWLDREITLKGVPGFMSIRFMKEDSHADHVPYASETQWVSRTAYENWRVSDAFRSAHKDVGTGEPLTLEKRETRFYDILKTVE